MYMLGGFVKKVFAHTIAPSLTYHIEIFQISVCHISHLPQILFLFLSHSPKSILTWSIWNADFLHKFHPQTCSLTLSILRLWNITRNAAGAPSNLFLNFPAGSHTEQLPRISNFLFQSMFWGTNYSGSGTAILFKNIVNCTPVSRTKV